MPVVLRPFQEADVSAAGEIAAAMRPPYLAEEGMTLWQEAYRVAENRFCLVAWVDDVVIGCGALWNLRADRFRVDLMVHPQWQRRGVGGALWDRLSEEARQRGAARVQARARDDRSTALSFLRNRGFIETQRMQRFVMDPAEADLAKLRTAIERVEQRGVTLTTLATAQAEDPDCLRKLHQLYLAVIPDWPEPDPGPVPAEPPSFSDYLRQLGPLAVVAETLLLATVEDRLVGFCGSLGTAVHPVYRGWGIATAMEARMIERARRERLDRLIGQSANPAMCSVYAKLELPACLQRGPAGSTVGGCHLMMIAEHQTQAYARDGVLSGLPIMSDLEVGHFRQQFDELEATEGQERAQNKLFDRHFDQPFIWEIATHPKILDSVESLIGPDILLLSTHFFCKYGPDDRFVAWHQDLRYWGLEPPEEVSAWYAVDDSGTENGCMRVIPGSHREGLIEHGRSETKGNLLSINQELRVGPEDEKRAVDCLLKAGEISLHHGLLVHGSLPNRSPRRRCGLTIRYIPPSVRPLAPGPIGTDWRWRPILVRGEDLQQNFDRVEPPFLMRSH